MIDLVTEDPVALADARNSLPPIRAGKRIHVATMIRWIMRGVRSPSGTLVRLEAARLGSRWITTKQALQRFLEAITPIFSGESSPPARRTMRQRRQGAARAGKQLAADGI